MVVAIGTVLETVDRLALSPPLSPSPGSLPVRSLQAGAPGSSGSRGKASGSRFARVCPAAPCPQRGAVWQQPLPTTGLHMEAKDGRLRMPGGTRTRARVPYEGGCVAALHGTFRGEDENHFVCA